MNTVNLIVGDWSHDGHNKTDIIIIQTNRTARQVESAYKKGKKKAGVDIVENCCADYEEREIKDVDLQKLKKVGVKSASFFEKDVFGGPDEWARLYLDVCKLGDPKLKFKIINNYSNEIHIGGYGLFGS